MRVSNAKVHREICVLFLLLSGKPYDLKKKHTIIQARRKKIMKKVLSTVLVIGMVASLLAGCGASKTESSDAATAETTEAVESTEVAEEATEETEATAEPASDVKVGVILVGDETEGYTKAHIDGIIAATKNAGLADSNVLWKYNVPESDDCYAAAKELVANGCTLIISNSYGHQDYMAEAAEEFTDVSFVAMTGDYAAISGLDNYYNAFTDVYESRFVSGVIAGMKIAQLVEEDKIPESGYDADKNVRIGYVGAFPYAEVVSGYTAFFLGIKSVYPQVAMEVTYTNSWFDIEAEGAAAESLMADGCVVIGQHADSTGAPTAVQTAQEKNEAVVYSVGYNVDMLSVAKTAALTSATNEWAVYYTELLQAFSNGEAVPQDWSEGYADSAVGITELGESCAEGTAEKVAEIEAALKDGTLHVFDTTTFTVAGEAITSSPVDLSYFDYSSGSPVCVYQGETVEAIATDANGGTYFDESSFRAAPYFSLRIDGITELN